MQICRMDYNDLSADRKKAKFHCYGKGTFEVFSGQAPRINMPRCSFIENAALPPGQYWIVDRPLGGIKNRILTFGKDTWFGTNHDEWFGLYNFQTMSDTTFVNGISRGAFRLHPLRPDGTGESWGCITFFRNSDFQQVRRAILSRKKFKVPGSRNGLLAYGRVDVTGSKDYDRCAIK
ncbi:Protein of uncharacterised function (DUF2778) [Serratia quinivorans]|nr:Protein of uncharacterised function (DUF2778) [Serratia quinivorans]